MKKLFIVLCLIFITSPLYAHSGRLDWKGGHKVNKEWVYEGKYIEIKDNKPEIKENMTFKKGDYHFHCKPSLNKINLDTFRDGIYLPVKDTNEVIE